MGVIDADIYGSSMHLMFDLVDAVPRAVEFEGKRRMSPPENYGVKVLSIGFLLMLNKQLFGESYFQL